MFSFLDLKFFCCLTVTKQQPKITWLRQQMSYDESLLMSLFSAWVSNEMVNDILSGVLPMR